MTQREDVLAWMDLEMTGLEPDTDTIVQLGMILTDRNLQAIAPPLEITIWQPESVLANMTPFVRAMHEKSGLLAQIRGSQVSMAEAEQRAMALLSEHARFRTARLCGNSVWQDRRFLLKYMPLMERYLHYRQVDVSTVKELSSWWYGEVFEKSTTGEHTSLCDVRQSIAELAFYRKSILRRTDGSNSAHP